MLSKLSAIPLPIPTEIPNDPLLALIKRLRIADENGTSITKKKQESSENTNTKVNTNC